MSRPLGTLPASELRPPPSQVRTSCGFCEAAHGQAPGVCHDAAQVVDDLAERIRAYYDGLSGGSAP